MVVLNGYIMKESELEDEAFEESVIHKVMQFTTDIQMSVYKGLLTDRMSLLDWLMNKDTIMARLNPRVLDPRRLYIKDDQSLRLDDSSLFFYIKGITTKNKKNANTGLTLWVFTFH